ncbi:N-acetyllactosaminide beta-1,6-N-acetylglucosaminyl-transferase-like [Babylonia areolata]|uniref:N-acetyllactosaminide beta-1,6-N-acetylglucosaminyl-transferase-like n=1 Tax=Babylonia areolata TaxID=304850 RepID=UPI003FD39CF0
MASRYVARRRVLVMTCGLLIYTVLHVYLILATTASTEAPCRDPRCLPTEGEASARHPLHTGGQQHLTGPPVPPHHHPAHPANSSNSLPRWTHEGRKGEGRGQAARTRGRMTSPEGQGSGAGDRRHFRPFPPLGRPVLPGGVDCRQVWQGKEGEVRKALAQVNTTLPARRPPGFYRGITANCSLYRRQAGYIKNVSAEEREFPLAFSLMVYKEPEQVERLLRAVYRPHNVYCLHVDLKTLPQVVQDLRDLTSCLPNVLWTKERLDVEWGHFNVLLMEVLCMRTLWASGVTWRYFINLTGQEFPLKTNRELVRILRAYNGANDILGETPKPRNMWRWAKAGNPPHNITVAKGPVHVAASRGFVDFALHSQQAQDLLEWTKKTGIPDETFFATLNNMHQFGVPGSYTGRLTDKHRIMLNRFKIWTVRNWTCSGQYVRNICHFGPREVALLAQSRHLVANKFSYHLHPLALDCTEQWYFQRVAREERTGGVDVDTAPYRRLVIVRHALRPANTSWG